MRIVSKLVLPLAAAAAISVPCVSAADCVSGHKVTASASTSQSVAQNPNQTPAPSKPGHDG